MQCLAVLITVINYCNNTSLAENELWIRAKYDEKLFLENRDYLKVRLKKRHQSVAAGSYKTTSIRFENCLLLKYIITVLADQKLSAYTYLQYMTVSPSLSMIHILFYQSTTFLPKAKIFLEAIWNIGQRMYKLLGGQISHPVRPNTILLTFR